MILRKKKTQPIGINFCADEAGIPPGLIYSVDQDSLAFQANLQEGQQIISVNDQPAFTTNDIVQMIQNHAGILILDVANLDEVIHKIVHSKYS